jgi:hypothetical protein
LIEPERAVSVLQAAGTSEHYRGLYLSAQYVQRLDNRALNAVAADFPETATIPPIADAMVQIEHTHDHLKALADAGWRPLPGQPDLDAPHEALLLKEHYRELSRTPDAQKQPEAFRNLLSTSEKNAEELELALRSWEKSGRADAARARLSALFAAATKNCAACHERFRDVPLGEKRR